MIERKPPKSDLAHYAWQILREVCDQVGLDTAGAELLRVRSNAVFRLRAPIVVRIATAPRAITRLPTVLAATRWLGEQGFPAVQPAGEVPDQPVVHSGAAVTFWSYIPESPAAVTTADLGRLLRRLHDMTPPMSIRTLRNPLEGIRDTVRHRPGVLDAGEQVWLTERIAALSDAWHCLPFAFPPTLLHGDAWIDNLMRHRSGHVVLGDWDGVATGPREWDLVHSYHGQRRFGLSQADVDDFASAYGHDLRRWSGYGTLLQIRDIYAIGIHIRNAPADPFSRKELTRRMRSLKNGTELDRWYMKDPLELRRLGEARRS